MNTPYPSFPNPAAEATPRRLRDVTWGRVLFHPPLLNPRLMFDPLPFRAQSLPRPSRSRSPFQR
jgi:hypothetical protein